MIIIEKSNKKGLENLSAEELKNQIQLTESKITKIKKDKKKDIKKTLPKAKSIFNTSKIDFGLINLDKITKIDDILKEFFNQQKLTNKLLLQLVRQTEITPQILTTGGLGQSKYTTNVKEWDNLDVTDNIPLINEGGSGILSELVMISDSTNTDNKAYSVQIIADGKTIWNDSWTNFETKSPYFSEMTAFDDETYYVLAFQSIAYDKTLNISIYEAPAVSFTSIFLKTIRKVG